MDPYATIRMIGEAIDDGRDDEALASIADLREWIDKGGFVAPLMMAALTDILCRMIEKET